MATVVPTRRRSSLLKGPPRRQSSTASTAAEKGESSSNPQQPPPAPAAVRKPHEQLAQCRTDFFKRMQASLEEATTMGRRADVLGEHQRVQVRVAHAMQSIDRSISIDHDRYQMN